MDTLLIICLTIIILISIITSLYIILYNKLQFYKIRIDEAQKIITEELENRYSLLKETKKLIEKNTKMDLNIFEHIEKIKNSNITSYNYEKELTKAINTIYVLKDDYPKLEEKKAFKDILIKLDESDTRIGASKSYYNRCNSNLTTLIKSFPSNIIALIHGIHIQPFYDGKEIFNENDDGIKI